MTFDLLLFLLLLHPLLLVHHLLLGVHLHHLYLLFFGIKFQKIPMILRS